MHYQNVIAMTQSVARAIKDKRLSLAVVLDYSQMRDLFSQNDLAALIALQTYEPLTSVREDDFYALTEKWRSSAQEHLQELDSVVLPLSKSELVINHLQDELFLPQGKELDPNATPVQVIDLKGSGIAMILDRGAVQYLNIGANKYTVVRAVMDVFMKYISLDKLTHREWFKRFVHLTALYSRLQPPQPVIS